jgi:GNAT superfamily N-acetyltransferase
MTVAAKPSPQIPGDISIRSATSADVGTILSLIRDLSVYENLAHELEVDESRLAQNLFGPHHYAECLIAEANGQPAGFALFFHSFSTFLGKPGLYLEDLFVKPEYRMRGIGLRLFRELARIALERDCGRMEWSVLDWNELALTFYKKLGAQPMSEWTIQRLTRPGIEILAREPSPADSN